MPIAIHLELADGRRLAITGRPGQSLMRAATDAGVEAVVAECGGTLTCATCHVVVDEAWRTRLRPPSPDEAAMLELTAAPREAGSRLSCQVELADALDGLVVRVPDRQY